ncbi:MaoC family dehydratase [Nannocystaceae bacterium ST9]
MPVSPKHILHQGPVIASLGATALTALHRRLGGPIPEGTGPLPGPELRITVPPRPRDLIHDYVRFCGGDPSSYKHAVPPHLWPQWGFPLAARTLEQLPYPIFKVLNGGCRVEVRAPLPIDEPLEVRAQLIDVDDNGRRAVLEQRVITGTAAVPEAVIATMYAIVPLGSGKGEGEKAGAKKVVERVPLDAEELARWRIPRSAGFDFAKLTGDFNPVHWIPAYARAFGFRSTILHGFASMAKSWEGLVRSRFAGSTAAIRSFDIKFTKPMVLPAEVGLYIRNEGSSDRVWLGRAHGGPAYLVGSLNG